jgi:hypothetical protein
MQKQKDLAFRETDVNRYTQLKLALAAIGVIVWAYGYRSDNSVLRWIGIIFLVAAVILRLVPKRLRGSDYPPT